MFLPVIHPNETAVCGTRVQLSGLMTAVDRILATYASWRMAAEKEHDVVESRNLGPDPGAQQLLDLAHSESRGLITSDAVSDVSSIAIVKNSPV